LRKGARALLAQAVEAARANPTDRSPDQCLHPVEPDMRAFEKANKCVQFGYGLNYLIDIGIAAARLRRASYTGSTVMSASANRLPSGR
jgi:hypothetical protein